MDWFVLASVCAMGAVFPGASLAFLLGVRQTQGSNAAFAAALGHGMGVGLCALGAVFGLAAMLAAAPAASEGLRAAGAAYLIWLGWQMWPRETAASSNQVGSAAATDRHPGAAFFSGFLVAVLNPKVLIFFAGVFAALAPPSAGVSERLAMALLAAVIDAAWYALVGVLGGVAAAVFARIWVQKVLVLVIFGFGAALLLSSGALWFNRWL